MTLAPRIASSAIRLACSVLTMRCALTAIRPTTAVLSLEICAPAPRDLSMTIQFLAMWCAKIATTLVRDVWN